MLPALAPTLVVLLALLFAEPAAAQGFKFSQPDDSAKMEEAARQDRIAYELSTPCRADLKGKKIMVIIGEDQGNGYINAQQQDYGRHFQAINSRLRSLGLRTFTPEEIRAQIARAEADARSRKDSQAAQSAAQRLGASFVLRGLITSAAGMNPIIPVNQVAVSMSFTLSTADGRIISEAGANGGSYAGDNIAQIAWTLVNEQADEVVAKLYGDYCRNAGFTATPVPKGK